ncbi:nuclear transport factor 2 family protein [Streptomyces sp. NPDC046237]|uniref:nuclear transport factor 2 family protein n=1 Tax=Streptomyces sp. NPDC046237 TaxID=3154914 RepID=UPI0033D2CF43
MDVVARFNEAFNRHDIEAVMGLMTDDVALETRAGGASKARSLFAPFWLVPSS